MLQRARSTRTDSGSICTPTLRSPLPPTSTTRSWAVSSVKRTQFARAPNREIRSASRDLRSSPTHTGCCPRGDRRAGFGQATGGRSAPHGRGGRVWLSSVATVTARWKELSEQRPDLADAGRSLFYQFGAGLGFLATIRREGGPRVHPVCPFLTESGLYVFVEPSPKRGAQWPRRRQVATGADAVTE